MFKSGLFQHCSRARRKKPSTFLKVDIGIILLKSQHNFIVIHQIFREHLIQCRIIFSWVHLPSDSSKLHFLCQIILVLRINSSENLSLAALWEYVSWSFSKDFSISCHFSFPVERFNFSYIIYQRHLTDRWAAYPGPAHLLKFCPPFLDLLIYWLIFLLVRSYSPKNFNFDIFQIVLKFSLAVLS